MSVSALLWLRFLEGESGKLPHFYMIAAHIRFELLKY